MSKLPEAFAGRKILWVVWRQLDGLAPLAFEKKTDAQEFAIDAKSEGVDCIVVKYRRTR